MADIRIPQMEPWFGEEEAKAVFGYMKSGGWIMEFKKTAELEQVIADFTRAKHCVITTNGTISLTLALLALGLKPGDEVLVPDFTMIATPNAAKLVGIKPVLVDIEPETLCLDLTKAQAAITLKTKALIYVAFNGRSGDMDAVKEFCHINNLFLIEDAAQALGSFWHGKHLGTFGEFGSFSFSAPKVISMGQGGALITNDEKLSQKIKKLKDFGREKGGVDTHDDLGWNFKFTDIQAVIGSEQMKKLPWRVERKKEIYRRYQEGLKDLAEVEFISTNLTDTSPWFIDIFVQNPDSLSAFLKERGIGARRVYPAIHTQKIYRDEYREKPFPVAEKYASGGLWLPSSSKLSDEEVDLVVGAIKVYYSK